MKTISKAIAVLFLVLSCHLAYAGKGAFLTIANTANFPVKITLTNSANDQWNVPVTLPDDLVLKEGHQYPMGGLGQYIEANGWHRGTSSATINASYTIAGKSYTNSITINQVSGTYNITSSTDQYGYWLYSTFVKGDQCRLILYFTINAGTQNWMTQDTFVQNATLRHITLPGVHDAAMSVSYDCTAFANNQNTQTQTTALNNIIAEGARFLDLRAVVTGANLATNLGHFGWVDGTPISFIDTLFAYYPTAYGAAIDQAVATAFPTNIELGLLNQGCLGNTLTTALSQIITGLNANGANSHEVVLLEISHFMDIYNNNTAGSNYDSTDLALMITSLQSSLQGYLYQTNNGSFLDTPIKRITATGPKIIVMIDTPGLNKNLVAQYINGKTGLYITPAIYNNYCDCNTDTMGINQFRQMSEYYSPTYYDSALAKNVAYDSSHFDSLYFVLSWTLTQSSNQAIACALNTTGFNAAIQVAGVLLQSLPQMLHAVLGPATTILQLSNNANMATNQIVEYCQMKKTYPNIAFFDNFDAHHTLTTMQLNRLRQKEHNDAKSAKSTATLKAQLPKSTSPAKAAKPAGAATSKSKP